MPFRTCGAHLVLWPLFLWLLQKALIGCYAIPLVTCLAGRSGVFGATKQMPIVSVYTKSSRDPVVWLVIVASCPSVLRWMFVPAEQLYREVK
ncbi:hypothetical protein AR540_05495 [Pseudomonas sp. EpS/L25]|nr:hypothetical protein AR540_05495 [Pseudomonas sp. EpS/L25]